MQLSKLGFKTQNFVTPVVIWGDLKRSNKRSFGSFVLQIMDLFFKKIKQVSGERSPTRFKGAWVEKEKCAVLWDCIIYAGGV